MSDFNKGDFTQQGVDGHVRATLRLNEKRYVELDLTTNENARGCTISGNVHDRLNNLDYPIGAAKTIKSKTITENGTYNASSDDCDGYNPVTVNVSGGGGLSVYTCTLHCHNGLDEPFDFADTINSNGFSAYAIDPETNYLMPATNISAVVEPNESLDIVLFIQVVEGGLLACVLEGEYPPTVLYNAVNCSRIYNSGRDQTAISCEQGKNAEVTFDVGPVE